MTQYLLLIHGNAKIRPPKEEWKQFFATAQASGFFNGGSEIGNRILIGDQSSVKSSEHLVGYMRFDSEDKKALLELINRHPVVTHGGTVELCELPLS